MVGTMSDAQPVIVLVEDDPNIADLVDMYLRQDGYRVYQAGDGETGLRAGRATAGPGWSCSTWACPARSTASTCAGSCGPPATSRSSC